MTVPIGLVPPVVGAPVRSVDRRALLCVPAIRRFLALQGVGQAADAMITLTLAEIVVFGLEQGATPGAIARTLLTATLPLLLVGPVAGIVTDRWDRRRVLAASNTARAVLALAAIGAPLLDSRAIGYGVASLLLAAAGISFTVRSACLPHLAPEARLVSANSLTSITSKIAGSCGFAIATIVGTSSPIAVLCVAAALHVVSALGFGTFAVELGGHDRGAGRDHGAMRASVLGIARSWIHVARRLFDLATTAPTRGAILAAVTQRFFYGAAFSTFILVADDRYDLDASGYAAAIATTATGAFVGTLTAPLIARRFGDRTVVAAAFSLGAGATLAAWLQPHSGVVILAMIVVSYALQVVRLVADATVQREIDDDALGRVFAGYDAAYNLAFVAGALLLVVTHRDDPVANFLTLSVGYAVCATARLHRSIRTSRRA